jgi:magnesium-transporting ATPase (P-type)
MTVAHYRNTAQDFARRGFRSLGVAIKEEGKDWELLGIMSMSDPPRSDTAAVSIQYVPFRTGVFDEDSSFCICRRLTKH